MLNLTDGSSGTITDNDGTTVTATLSGGTEDDWDVGDDYDIVFDDTQADGVLLRGGSVYAGGHAGIGNVFHDNNIYNNHGDGMENQITTTVDAECNWWGNALGPNDPSGTVVGDVDFAPWLLSAAPDGTCYDFTSIIDTCVASSNSHGQFISCVTKVAKGLVKDGTITPEEMGGIVTWASLADLP